MTHSSFQPPTQRLLADLRGEPGPTLVIIAGIHGNEPGGIIAVRRIIEALESLPIRGRLVVLAGNLASLATGERFRDRDLNRQWNQTHLDALARRKTSLSAEDHEQLELHRAIQTVVEETPEPLQLLDLHSFSASGPPFAILGDTLRNRRLAFPLAVPVILGLEELIDGTLLEYMVDRGHVAVVVEGGSHTDPVTADRLEAATWLALEATGILTVQGAGPQLAAARAVLDDASDGLPRAVEVFHRHALDPNDHFVMNPGYQNFQPVARGELLAQDRDGSVPSPTDGRILMPLYQSQGDDGFFLSRRVRMFWLQLSALIRRSRVGELLTRVLPGVQRSDARGERLLVDPRIARWMVVEFFRLLGYRPAGMVAGRLRFSRRPE